MPEPLASARIDATVSYLCSLALKLALLSHARPRLFRGTVLLPPRSCAATTWRRCVKKSFAELNCVPAVSAKPTPYQEAGIA
jgi:hypothetical protein